jgi:hypothetical protein
MHPDQLRNSVLLATLVVCLTALAAIPSQLLPY